MLSMTAKAHFSPLRSFYAVPPLDNLYSVLYNPLPPPSTFYSTKSLMHQRIIGLNFHFSLSVLHKPLPDQVLILLLPAITAISTYTYALWFFLYILRIFVDVWLTFAQKAAFLNFLYWSCTAGSSAQDKGKTLKLNCFSIATMQEMILWQTSFLVAPLAFVNKKQSALQSSPTLLKCHQSQQGF